MAIISSSPLLPGLTQRIAAAKVKLGSGLVATKPVAQKIPATSLWYESSTLYFVGASNSVSPFAIAFSALSAFSMFGSCNIFLGGLIPQSVYPAPYNPQTVPGYGWISNGAPGFACIFACTPGMVGMCVPAVKAVAPTWIKWAVESTQGIGVKAPVFSLPAGFGPLCPGLPSTVQTLCASGLTTVTTSYVLLGAPVNLNVGAGSVAPGCIEG